MVRKLRTFLIPSISLLLLLGLTTTGNSAPLQAIDVLDEVEPNNTTATANSLPENTFGHGNITPVTDVDYFSLTGYNPGWGFIALLDSSASTGSKTATLTAIERDGVTVLRSDTGSWKNGSGIALQNFASGDGTYFLKVNELGNDATVTPYSLRYIRTIVMGQPEVEPNGTYNTANHSSMSNDGTISTTSDVDCFAFHGRPGDEVVFALDGDPEKNGSLADLALDFYDPSGTLLDSANYSGAGGGEFIEYGNLIDNGAYAYCVRFVSGTAGTAATYKAGLVRNGAIYVPTINFNIIWTDPRPGNYALVGDAMNFTLSVTNAGPLPIPGKIRIFAEYAESCLDFVSGNPVPSSINPGYIKWEDQKTGLAVSETYSVNLTLTAQAYCYKAVTMHIGTDFYFTFWGTSTSYMINTFSDVPPTYWSVTWIERLYASGITTGCNTNPLLYCPEQPVTRAEMAVFLVRGKHSPTFDPPTATGIFSDVPIGYWAADFIEQLYADGITIGCILSPLQYCPGQSVTRAEMAAFLLRAKYGQGYNPPSATGVFSDVPTSHWAAKWIEKLYADGITTGCKTAPLRYCPEQTVTRAEMAAFLVRTFGLP